MVTSGFYGYWWLSVVFMVIGGYQWFSMVTRGCALLSEIADGIGVIISGKNVQYTIKDKLRPSYREDMVILLVS